MIIENFDNLNKQEKVKILFHKETIIRILIEKTKAEIKSIHDFNLKIKITKLLLSIGLILSISLLLFINLPPFQTNCLIILSIFLLVLEIFSNPFFKKLENKKNKNEELLFNIDGKRWLRISVDDENLIKGNISDHLSKFTLSELVDFEKDEIFFNQIGLNELMKKLNVMNEEISKILKSKEYIEYVLLESTTNNEYNFLKKIYEINKDNIKDYIRENYNSDFIKENKELIKEEINKNKDFFQYELLIINKI